MRNWWHTSPGCQDDHRLVYSHHIPTRVCMYIYIPPSSEVCTISDPNEKNALALWGAKKNVQGLKCIFDQNCMPLIVDALLPWGNMGHAAKQQPWIISNKFNLCGRSQKWTIAFVSVLHMPKVSLFIHEFLCLGRVTSEPLHVSFFTWDTTQVNHFIWISLLGTRHNWTTSYEFLYLGHDTSEPLHMSFFNWDTPQANHFIWISLLGTRHKWTTSYEFLYLGHATSEPLHEFLCLGHATSEPLHMNFYTWSTPQVNHFIWISLYI